MAELGRAGFRCVERPFTYSAWPGTYGVQATGVALAIAGIIACLGHGTAELATSLTLVMAALAVGTFLARSGTVLLPWMRRSAINIEAVRGAEEPKVWLVAHLDSKSQTISMRVRVIAVVTGSIAWIALTLLATLPSAASVPGVVFLIVALIATAASVPLIACRLGSEGSGALDNASGVAAVVGAAGRLDPRADVGILLTSGEELGLAGARAWVRGRDRGVVVNCDSVDDQGALICMPSGVLDDHFRDAIHRAGMMVGEEVDIRPLVPGILVDAVAFKDAGWRAVTVSRGTWATLARIHTPMDDLAHMQGQGIVATANFLARVSGAIVAKRAT